MTGWVFLCDDMLRIHRGKLKTLHVAAHDGSRPRCPRGACGATWLFGTSSILETTILIDGLAVAWRLELMEPFHLQSLHQGCKELLRCLHTCVELAKRSITQKGLHEG